MEVDAAEVPGDLKNLITTGRQFITPISNRSGTVCTCRQAGKLLRGANGRQAANHTRGSSLGRKLINGRAETAIGRPPEINEATRGHVDLDRSSD